MTATSLADLLVVNPSRLRPATLETVASAQEQLGIALPTGYVDFATRLGAGSLGHFVWVEDVATLPDRTREWRERITAYWFWETDEAGVTADALQQRGVLLASSFDGDELCVDPADVETLYVLPRNEEVAHRVGPGFVAALEWMLSGALNPWVEGWTFEVNAGRAQVRDRLRGRRLGDAEAAVLADHGDAHVEHLDGRTTIFLPSVQGRLALHDEDGELDVDLGHDEEADPAKVAAVLGAVRGA